MIKDFFIDSLSDIWPMIVIILVIISSLRITYIITKHKRFLLHKEIIYLIAIIYILCLFYVVTFQDKNFGTSNYIPFKEILLWTEYGREDIGGHIAPTQLLQIVEPIVVLGEEGHRRA